MNTLEDRVLSIGALSRAAGIPAETLRTWERRYGVPVAHRTPSGHRRYDPGTLNWLKLVARAIAAGHHASEALRMDQAVLQACVERSGPDDRELSPPRLDIHRELDEWFAWVARTDRPGFDAALRRSWARHGAYGFLDQIATPFLEQLGTRWQRGAIGVRHEHFASERLTHFLALQWGQMSLEQPRGHVVCAALPGESHVIGLHLAAVVAALSEWGVVFLGANTPVDDIVSAARELKTDALLVSASACLSGELVRAHMSCLGEQLDPKTPLVVGGAGLVAYRGRAVRPASFFDLGRWFARRAVRRAEARETTGRRQS